MPKLNTVAPLIELLILANARLSQKKKRPLCLTVDIFRTPESFCIILAHDSAAIDDKNSSGDEITNSNFYAVRPEATRIR